MRLYSAQEVADHFEVDLRTIYDWIEKGWLRPIKKIGETRIFNQKGVDRVARLRSVDDDLLNETEMAKAVGISRQAFRDLRRRYHIDPVQRGPGRAIYFPRSIVEKLKPLVKGQGGTHRGSSEKV